MTYRPCLRNRRQVQNPRSCPFQQHIRHQHIRRLRHRLQLDTGAVLTSSRPIQHGLQDRIIRSDQIAMQRPQLHRLRFQSHRCILTRQHRVRSHHGVLPSTSTAFRSRDANTARRLRPRARDVGLGDLDKVLGTDAVRCVAVAFDTNFVGGTVAVYGDLVVEDGASWS